MKPDDTAPVRINEDYNCPVTSNRDRETSLFLKTDEKKMTIKYANYGEELHIKTIPPSRLIGQSCRAKKQRQRVSKYANVLWTEQLIGYYKLGL